MSKQPVTKTCLYCDTAFAAEYLSGIGYAKFCSPTCELDAAYMRALERDDARDVDIAARAMRAAQTITEVFASPKSRQLGLAFLWCIIVALCQSCGGVEDTGGIDQALGPGTVWPGLCCDRFERIGSYWLITCQGHYHVAPDTTHYSICAGMLPSLPSQR